MHQNEHIVSKNSQLVYGRGSSQLEACIASPTPPPYVGSTHNHCSALLCTQCSTNNILHILVKAQPSTTGHGHLLGLAYDHKTWAYSTYKSWHMIARPGPTQLIRLGHCGLSSASTHKLAFTSRHYILLTATDTIALY